MLTLSDEDLVAPSLGTLERDAVVYIRPMTVLGRRVHVLCASDGMPLAVTGNREQAFATAAQYDMTPVSVH